MGACRFADTCWHMLMKCVASSCLDTPTMQMHALTYHLSRRLYNASRKRSCLGNMKRNPPG